jgi:hypothetical protein
VLEKFRFNFSPSFSCSCKVGDCGFAIAGDSCSANLFTWRQCDNFALLFVRGSSSLAIATEIATESAKQTKQTHQLRMSLSQYCWSLSQYCCRPRSIAGRSRSIALSPSIPVSLYIREFEKNKKGKNKHNPMRSQSVLHPEQTTKHRTPSPTPSHDADYNFAQ